MASSLVFAQEADPLFQSDEILQVTIEGPLTTLIDEKSKEDYLDGFFRYTDADGSPVEFDVKLRARGNFRHANCDYPPVRLNFKKSQEHAFRQARQIEACCALQSQGGLLPDRLTRISRLPGFEFTYGLEYEGAPVAGHLH